MSILPHHQSSWVVQHAWTLSIEEHFYLVWPSALVVLGSRRARSILLLILPLTIACRYASWTVFRHWFDLNYEFITPNRIDTIAAGCLLACVVCDNRARPWLGRLGRWGTIIFFAAVLIVAVSAKARLFSEVYDITLGRTVEAAAIAMCILAVVSSPHTVIGRLLETRPLAVVGVLCYSLYLWQQPFLNPWSELWISRWPQNFLLATAAAIASHLLVERPFLRLKDRVGHRAAEPASV
jgi:peptidoglycan/LPS O-acetylase OafA/YrhL